MHTPIINDFTKKMRTKKIRNLLITASGAAVITLIASGSPAKAVDMFQSQEIKVSSVIPLPGLVPTATQSDNAVSTESTTRGLDLEKFFKAYGTPISISGAIFTYLVNERWKRRQYIDQKIKYFENQPETINVRKMLNAELQCVELFPFLDNPRERFVFVEDDLWTRALLESKCNEVLRQEHEKGIQAANPFIEKPVWKAVIRDNFNMFLNHLQQFEKMIVSKAVNESELKNYLDAWIEMIDRVGEKHVVDCPVSESKYTPREALLEYLGLTECNPNKNPSVVQENVKKIIGRYRQLDEKKRLVKKLTYSDKIQVKMREILKPAIPDYTGSSQPPQYESKPLKLATQKQDSHPK